MRVKSEETQIKRDKMPEGGSQRKLTTQTHTSFLQIRNDWAAYYADSRLKKTSEHAATHKQCREANQKFSQNEEEGGSGLTPAFQP